MSNYQETQPASGASLLTVGLCGFNKEKNMPAQFKIPTSIKTAEENVRDARQKLLEVLQLEYPVGSRVLVRHWRGSFFGEVVGHRDGSEIWVKNDRSGKATTRLPSELERVA